MIAPVQIENTPACDGAKQIDGNATDGWFATESQRQGLARLNAVADLFERLGRQRQAGFRLSINSLLIGQTGSGKTNLARHFAKNRNSKEGTGWAFCSIDAGSWVVEGAASKPATLHVIRDFVRSSQGPAVLFIDEIDKLLPRGPNAYTSAWSMSVFSEVISILDGGDERLLAHEWSRKDVQRLCDQVLILGGGAFMDAMAEVRNDRQRGALGFNQADRKKVSHSGQITASQHLPDEILTRFASFHIILEAPSDDDFRRGIERIHHELGIASRRPIEDLLVEARQFPGGMRYLENYLMEICIANPEAVQPIENDSEVESKGYDFFAVDMSHYVRQATDASFALRADLVRILAQMEVVRESVEKSKHKEFCAYLYCAHEGDETLMQLLIPAIKASGACSDVSKRDDDALLPIMQFRERIWGGIRQHSAQLSACELLPLWTKSWDNASRVIEIRYRLARMAQQGRL